jgi:hypothetical protein
VNAIESVLFLAFPNVALAWETPQRGERLDVTKARLQDAWQHLLLPPRAAATSSSTPVCELPDVP